jgi:hypothetical protein
VDLYISAKQALTWLFESRLLVPGSLVRYDDWQHGTTTGADGSSWGEPKAHMEATREFGVRWQALSCERRCPPKRDAAVSCRLCEYKVLSVRGRTGGNEASNTTLWRSALH